MSAIKRTALDSIFSDCIRERNDWVCEACAKDFKHDRGMLQCAHIVGRRVMRLRHDPLNGLALCASCHAYYELRPLEFATFVRGAIGEPNAMELRRLSNLVHKRPKGWEKEARKHFREQLTPMLNQRKNGTKGYIEFVGYW